MTTSADLKKMAKSVRDIGVTSERNELLVKKAHDVKIATMLVFLDKIK